MDNNPIQTPTPNPLANPAASGPQPVRPINNIPLVNPNLSRPLTPQPAPQPANTQPTTPVMGGGAQPVIPTAPANPVAPVNPVAPANPVMPAAPVNPIMPGQAPINTIFQPTNNNGMAPTAPLTQPEPAPAPDPIEEELKSPMKAAAPAPGSIGSAVSGPEVNDADAKDTMGANDAMKSMNKVVKPAKQGVSKNTLILIAIVGGLVAIALVVYLLMTLGVLSF